MDFQEALRELDVEADPGGDVVRRAYLRKLKTRKPEMDPEGFARLREAYETVLAHREGREGPRTQAAPLEAAADNAPSAEPPLDELESFLAELRALTPVDAARRAVEARPDAAEPRRWLVDALLEANRIPEAMAAYRDAYRQGHTEFLVELAECFPTFLEDAELPLLAQAVSHRFLWRLAGQLLRYKKAVLASKVGLAASERMGKNPESPPPPADWFMHFVLRLHQHVQPGPARALARRYVTCMDVERLREAFASQDVVRIWPLVEELGALPDSFSGTMRRVLAEVVLDGHKSFAESSFKALAKVRPEEAANAVHLLREHAPRLYQMMDCPAPPEPKTQRQVPRRAKAPRPAPAPAPAPVPKVAAWSQPPAHQDPPLVAELKALPDSFSGTLRRILREVVRDGNVGYARSSFNALAKARPEEASNAVHLLRQHAPGLYQLLDCPAPPEPKTQRRVPRRAKASGPATRAAEARHGAGTVHGKGPGSARPKGEHAAPSAAAASRVPIDPLLARPSRDFMMALRVLGVVTLLVAVLVVHNTRSGPDGGGRVPGDARIEAAQRQADVLCARFSGPERYRSCNHLQSLVVLGTARNCQKLYAEHIALRIQLGTQLIVSGAKDDPTLRDRQRQMDEAFAAFEQALVNLCQE
ncbi:hypothetical protein D7X30_23450 [Corallococcus sp. AB011P]|uniref:hypothetical protein n=1 Tax=Corallococcus sp. AB011P TaxID=2316735 RepID=UPI000EA20198|nr:hypothetical protein [Corallococcus sp. AB011P]RKG56523.1 hypothetical protein D7X30_23450 [Corallococcus sp. AB011P]